VPLREQLDSHVPLENDIRGAVHLAHAPARDQRG
jgi:hypothetical protein